MGKIADVANLLRDKINIIELIDSHTLLEKSDINYYKGFCALDDCDSTTKKTFTVSDAKKIFYCFKCHKSGDVVTFTQQIEKCNFIEACRLLIDKYKIDIPDELKDWEKDLNVFSDKEKNKIAEAYKKKRGALEAL